MWKKVALAVLAMMLVLPMTGLTAGTRQEQIVKVGDVTAFSGDVLIRSKGTWMKLEKVPFPIYNSDKLVTQQGRAEASFVGGGVLRVDIDSSLSIVQKKETEGVVFKKEVTVRQVNVAVGDIYFNVHVQKGSGLRYQVRTPSMTAAIRGSDGVWQVNEEGITLYALLSGTIDTYGSYFKYENPKPMDNAAIKVDKDKLPPRGPRANSRFHLNAQQAHQKQVLVRRPMTGRVSDRIKTSEDLKANAEASLASAEDVLAEAQAFNDTEVIKASQETVDAVNASMAKIDTMMQEAQRYQELAATTTDPQLKATYEAAAETNINAATAVVSTVVAQVSYDLALQSGDQTAIATSKSALASAKDSATKAEEKTVTVKEIVEIAASDDATADQKEAAAAAATTVKDSSAMNADAALAQSTVATQAAASDTQAVAAAQDVATTAETKASAVDSAIADITASVQAGDTDAVQTTTEAVKTAVETEPTPTDQPDAEPDEQPDAEPDAEPEEEPIPEPEEPFDPDDLSPKG